MCVEILVINGDERTECSTVGELAKALKMQPIMVSSVENRKSCLCNVRLDELKARRATKREGYPWPEYVIEFPIKAVKPKR